MRNVKHQVLQKFFVFPKYGHQNQTEVTDFLVYDSRHTQPQWERFKFRPGDKDDLKSFRPSCRNPKSEALGFCIQSPI